MRPLNAIATAAAIVAGAVSGFANPASAQVVAYEGARLIVGDGRVVENATIVVDGARITQAGAGVTVPADAARVNLAGKSTRMCISAQPARS
jgi:imidazolonepropionase-like amidohydrolase